MAHGILMPDLSWRHHGWLMASKKKTKNKNKTKKTLSFSKMKIAHLNTYQPQPSEYSIIGRSILGVSLVITGQH